MSIKLTPIVVIFFVLQSSALRADVMQDCQEVMQALANVTQAKATFEETRESGFLSSLMTVRGTLEYQSPHMLVRKVDEPFEEELTVDGDTVTLRRFDDGRVSKTRISLESHPEIKSVVESVRSTMAGDLSKLEVLFTIDWQGNKDDWSMALIPKSAALKEKITQIAIAGKQSQINSIITQEADGDESTMKITYLDSM